MAVYLWYRLLRLVHIYAAIVLVGAIIFNTGVLMPALRRIPPAHSAVVGQKIGGGLMVLGGAALALLGISGFARLWLLGNLGMLFSSEALQVARMRWTALMAVCWLGLSITGALSAVWFNTVLSAKLPYSAGLRELEERRAAQARVSAWQDRLAYVNLAFALLAALGGILSSY